MSIERIANLAESAVAAAAAGNYTLAISRANQARLLLALIPTSSRSSAGASTNLAFTNLASIDAFIAECRRQHTASTAAHSGPFTTSKIRYVRPGI